MSQLIAAQQEYPDTGRLFVNVRSMTSYRAIAGATVRITSTNTDGQVLEELSTDSSGQTETLTLPTPPLEYSMEPAAERPYSVYNVVVSAPGYEPVQISGAEVLSGETSIQNISLMPNASGEADSEELYVIPPHTLYGEYPPKIAESEIKDIRETGEIVLSRVVIPSGVRKSYSLSSF